MKIKYIYGHKTRYKEILLLLDPQSKYNKKNLCLNDNKSIYIVNNYDCIVQIKDKYLIANIINVGEEIKLPRLKHEFKPFQKVLVRYESDMIWKCDFFSYCFYKNEGNNLRYQCVGGDYYLCIPYKGNEYLLGTRKEDKNN